MDFFRTLTPPTPRHREARRTAAILSLTPRHREAHRAAAILSLAVTVMALITLPAHAADTSAAAAAALKVLTSPPPAPESAAAGSGSAPSGGRAVYVVKGSQTLDVAIQRALPNLPLKEAFLRQVFASLNPKALTSGATNVVLRSGTSLQVPTMDDLRFHLAQASPELMGLSGRKTASVDAGDDDAPELKKRWPRFP